MSRKCKLSNKKALKGNNVSHSKRRTRRKQEVNLQWKKFFNEETQEWERHRVSTRTIRTIAKLGLAAVLKKAKVAG